MSGCQENIDMLDKYIGHYEIICWQQALVLSFKTGFRCISLHEN